MFEPPSVLKNIEPTDAVTDPSGVPVPLDISDNAVELTVAAGKPFESNDNNLLTQSAFKGSSISFFTPPTSGVGSTFCK